MSYSLSSNVHSLPSIYKSLVRDCEVGGMIGFFNTLVLFMQGSIHTMQISIL